MRSLCMSFRVNVRKEGVNETRNCKRSNRYILKLMHHLQVYHCSFRLRLQSTSIAASAACFSALSWVNNVWWGASEAKERVKAGGRQQVMARKCVAKPKKKKQKLSHAPGGCDIVQYAGSSRRQPRRPRPAAQTRRPTVARLGEGINTHE